MGLFQRISNVLRGKANSALDAIENPVELLDQKIRDMEASLNTAKISSAQIIGNVHEIDKKIEDAKKDSVDFEEKVKLAVSKGNDELAKMALAKKIEADKKISNLQESYVAAKQKADSIKESLKELESEIANTRSYRDEAVARYNTAEASQKVNEILANVETRTNKINLDDIERKIQKKESMAEGLAELKPDNTLEDEFKKLEAVDLDEELKKYKQN